MDSWGGVEGSKRGGDGERWGSAGGQLVLEEVVVGTGGVVGRGGVGVGVVELVRVSGGDRGGSAEAEERRRLRCWKRSPSLDGGRRRAGEADCDRRRKMGSSEDVIGRRE